MLEKIANIIILFRRYEAGKDSLKLKTKKGLTIVTDDGLSFINGKWPVEIYSKHYAKIFKKSKIAERIKWK